MAEFISNNPAITLALSTARLVTSMREITG